MVKQRGGWRGGVKPSKPTTKTPMLNRSFKCTDDQWAKAKAKAKAAKITIGEYLRRKIDDSLNKK